MNCRWYVADGEDWSLLSGVTFNFPQHNVVLKYEKFSLSRTAFLGWAQAKKGIFNNYSRMPSRGKIFDHYR